MIYEKNLTQTVRLRLTDQQFAFLQDLATKRGTSISAQIRTITDDYARSLKMMEAIRNASNFNPYAEENERKGVMSNGDAETHEHDLV